MKSILFDKEGANSLNKLVQTSIAPHLFIICNYNPDAFCPISDDGKFLLAISNLYKFAIDCSLINRLSRIDNELGAICFRRNRNDFNECKKYLDTISILRTYAFHNNDHNETIEQAELWMLQVVNKRKCDTMEDYTKALRELEMLGERMLNICHTIIGKLVSTYSKADLEDALQRQIVSFYERNERIIENELKLAFRSQMAYPSGNVKSVYIADWCQKMYCGVLEQKISQFSKFRGLVKGDKKRKLEEVIAETDKQLCAIKQKVADKSDSCQGNTDKLSTYDFLSYYKYEVVNKCISKIPELKKKRYTMLPQDMIQYFISQDFQDVTIETQ